MKNTLEEITDFFPSSNLNNFLFYIHCPTLKEEEKRKISELIIKNRGVSQKFNLNFSAFYLNYKQKCTFNISQDTIIIVENQNFLKSINNKDLIKDYRIIYFYNKNHVEKIINKNGRNNNSRIRIITINSLKEEIDFFKPKNFKFFLENGLNKNFNPKSTIAVLLKNKSKPTQSLKSYSFYCENNLSNNDIPFYHPNTPDGFSLFCSQFEYMQILSYVKTEEYQIQIMRKKQELDIENMLKTEPEPNKKEFLCQVCKARFDNYLDHIKSNLHNKNKSSYLNTFNKIKLTFKRITDYNKKNNILDEKILKENINNIKINSNEQKEITNSTNITETTNIDTSKDDILSLISENKVYNLKEKILEKIPEKNNEMINEENKDITVKEILNILDTIEVKKDFGIYKLKRCKRKINEKNKYHFNENYIRDLKKITGKISYLNDLYNNK